MAPAAILLAAVPAAAQGARFDAAMTGAAMSPPNASPGVGTVVVVMDTVGHTLGVSMSFAGLLGPSTTAHIHCCTATPGAGTVGVATMTPSFAGFPAGVSAGTMSQVYDTTSTSAFSSSFVTANGGTAAGAEAALSAGLLAGRAYIDIHSSMFPGGEIRGFLAVVHEVLVSDVTQAEGSSGTTSFTFTVSLTAAAPGPVTVVAATANGTATAPADYTAAGPATITFNAGETSRSFEVLVEGDTLAELNEAFFVNLSNASGATIADAQGVGTIINDDGTPMPPTAVNDSYSTPFETPLIVAAPGVLANDINNAAGLEAVIDTEPAHGTVTLAGHGSFIYTPQGGYVGADAFTYRASNIAGSSVATVAVSVPVPTGPVRPGNLRVTAVSGNTVTFAWDPPELGAAPTGYQIEGGTSPGGVLAALTLGTAPMFTVALPTGALYVRVRTIAGGAVSGPSNEVLVHVNQPLRPSAPTGLLGLVNGTSVALAWRNTFEGGASTGLVLEVTGEAVMSVPLPPGDTFNHTGVPPGSYTLRVRAVNAFGASAPSNPVTLVFPGGCSGAPQPVQNFMAVATPGRLVLAWDPADTGPAPTGFVVNATGAYVGSVPLVSRGIDVAVPPGTYTLNVAAANPCGTSGLSGARTVTVP